MVVFEQWPAQAPVSLTHLPPAERANYSGDRETPVWRCSPAQGSSCNVLKRCETGAGSHTSSLFCCSCWWDQVSKGYWGGFACFPCCKEMSGMKFPGSNSWKQRGRGGRRGVCRAAGKGFRAWGVFQIIQSNLPRQKVMRYAKGV